MFKKGQTQQIFVWIFVVVVAGLILFFGIRLLKQTSDLKDEVVVGKFFNDLDKKLEQYFFLDKGSNGRENFLLPNGVEWVCFVDGNFPDWRNYGFVDAEDRKLIEDLSNFGNVFVGPFGLYENNRIKTEVDLKLEDGVFCKRASGGLVLDLENEGVVEGVSIK
jgi:hypothetical protein